jgi:GxxExxY protein
MVGLIMHQHNELTELAIRAFYKVYNTLGYGFLEKVYVNALIIEFDKINVPTKLQSPVQVHYDGKIIGEYFADIIVNDCIIIEIKAAKNLTLEHEAQLLNYLKATEIEVGLLLNFGPKPEVKRKIFDNARKRC